MIRVVVRPLQLQIGPPFLGRRVQPYAAALNAAACQMIARRQNGKCLGVGPCEHGSCNQAAQCPVPFFRVSRGKHGLRNLGKLLQAVLEIGRYPVHLLHSRQVPGEGMPDRPLLGQEERRCASRMAAFVPNTYRRNLSLLCSQAGDDLPNRYPGRGIYGLVRRLSEQGVRLPASGDQVVGIKWFAE